MKYLKLYERYEQSVDVCGRRLKSLNNIYKSYPNLETLFAYDNEIASLDGIDCLQKLKKLSIGGNKISDISMLENLPEFKELYCRDNLITEFSDKLLSKLDILVCYGNPLELPIPYRYAKKLTLYWNKFNDYDGEPSKWIFYGDDYHSRVKKFDDYEWQKWFIELYPERILDLDYIGLHSDLKEKYDYIKNFVGE